MQNDHKKPFYGDDCVPGVKPNEIDRFDVDGVATVVECRNDSPEPVDTSMHLPISCVSLGTDTDHDFMLVITSDIPGGERVQSIIQLDLFLQIFDRIMSHVERLRNA